MAGAWQAWSTVHNPLVPVHIPQPTDNRQHPHRTTTTPRSQLMATVAQRPLSARPSVATLSSLNHEPRYFNNRQRSLSAAVLPRHSLARDGFMGIPSAAAGLNSEAQHIWESLMTLHCSRYTPLSSHLARALPLLTHPSLPLPPALQILIFTSSLSPSLRALILSQHPNLGTLDEAVGAARLAERAKQRMDWIGQTMATLDPPKPSVMHRPSMVRSSPGRPSTGSASDSRRPSTGRLSISTSTPSPRSARKRSYDDDEESGRNRQKKRVKMQLTCDPSCTRRDHNHDLDEDQDRPSSSESSANSDRSNRSGMDALADAAVEAAREQFQRL